MRPVTKLPGNSVAVQAYYTPKTNFRFNKGAAKTYVKQKFKTTNPTATQCLTDLRRINGKTINTRTAGEKAFKKSMDKKMGKEYIKAADPLMFFLGNYCSYCETTIKQLAEVEHVKPKSTLTNLALDWDNFLLSCGPCNNAKSNKPSLTDVQALLNKAPTLAEYQDALDDYYIWPDKDLKTFRWIQYRLHRVTGAGTASLAANQQTSLGHTNALLDPVARTVTADILNPNNNVSTNRSVRVIATGTGGASAKPGNAAAAQRSLDLMQINQLRGDRHSYDSRVLRKTKCWFDALNAIARIGRITAANSTQQNYTDMWEQVMDTITSAGFFSTWLTVFKTYPNATQFNGDNYATKFLSFVNNNNFKNTDKTKLP